MRGQSRCLIGDPYKFWHTPKNISKMRRARDLKFGTQTQRVNISKSRKEKFRKGAWLRHGCRSALKLGGPIESAEVVEAPSGQDAKGVDG